MENLPRAGCTRQWKDAPGSCLPFSESAQVRSKVSRWRWRAPRGKEACANAKKMLRLRYLWMLSRTRVKLPAVYLSNRGLYAHRGPYVAEGQRAGPPGVTNLRGCFMRSPGNELTPPRTAAQSARPLRGWQNQRRRFREVPRRDAVLWPLELFLFCKIKVSVFLKFSSIHYASVLEPMSGRKVNKIQAIKKLGNYL